MGNSLEGMDHSGKLFVWPGFSLSWHRELRCMSPGSLEDSRAWGRMDTCICTAESLPCLLNYHTVNWLYANTRKKDFKIRYFSFSLSLQRGG